MRVDPVMEARPALPVFWLLALPPARRPDRFELWELGYQRLTLGGERLLHEHGTSPDGGFHQPSCETPATVLRAHVQVLQPYPEVGRVFRRV